MIALSQELTERGHDVVFFHETDVGPRVRSAGLRFHALAPEHFPAGHLNDSVRELGKLSGLAALRYTIRAVKNTTAMLCEFLPAAIRVERVDALIVDQMEPAGAAVAESLGIPFVSVSNALLINREPDIPPPFSPWRYESQQRGIARLRNRFGYWCSDMLTRSVTRTLNGYRRRWGLRSISTGDETFSQLAQISQLAKAFDYPRRNLPACFHYMGPLRKAGGPGFDFPWEKLDGRPLFFASLGSMQGSKFEIFRTIADACRSFDAQLLIAHGNGLNAEQANSFPGRPLVVPFAPQAELLSRAALTITHAGLNTVLDSLAHAVPLVAIPITFEQPAIANRIQWCGVGEVMPLRALSARRLEQRIQSVLENPRCRASARRIQNSIREGGGVQRAADIAETALGICRSEPVCAGAAVGAQRP